MFKNFIRYFFRVFGLEIRRFTQAGGPPMTAVPEFLRISGLLGAELILDVGANIGQFYQSVRSNGYQGEIISFEPNPQVHAELQRVAAGDRNWMLEKIALGDKSEFLTLHQTQDSLFSSLKLPNEELAQTVHGSVQSEVQVAVKPLMEVWNSLELDKKLVALKCDTQGNEMEMLRGAENHLDQVVSILMELTFRPLYSGESDFFEVSTWLYKRGYVLTNLFETYRAHHPLNELVQVDAVFARLQRFENVKMKTKT